MALAAPIACDNSSAIYDALAFEFYDGGGGGGPDAAHGVLLRAVVEWIGLGLPVLLQPPRAEHPDAVRAIFFWATRPGSRCCREDMIGRD